MKASCRLILFPTLFLLAISGGVFISKKEKGDFQEKCQIKTETKTLKGSSLSGLIEQGGKVKVLFGFYNCYPIKRGDIVVYSYPGKDYPLLKIVKGIPGDSFYLKKTKNGWHIFVNGKLVKNSQGIPYLLNESQFKILNLYQRDYKGKIPKNAYLILGNLPQGSLDSTKFGLVDKSSILGKAKVIEQENNN